MQVPRIEEYYRYSNEKEILIDLLKKNLKDHYQSSLDVGAGNGRISQVLSDRSKKLSLCEPNEYYFESLKNKFPHAAIIPHRIQDADLESYDCILASQSLYYHSPDNWINIIEKLLTHLVVGGDMHIIVNSDTGDWWNAVKTIWTTDPQSLSFNYLPSSHLIHQLKEKYVIHVSRFNYQMNFPNRTALENYIRRSCIPLKENKPQLEHLIESYLKSIPQNRLQMNYVSDLISLKKTR